MANDNDQDQESATSAFGRAFVNSAVGQVRSAARGAARVANTVKSAFGLAPGPGGDNSNFPPKETD
jgi:hypothetical protein